MEGDHAVGVHVPQVGTEGFRRDQVDRNRVTREGVDRQQVEVLRWLAFQRKPRVAQHGLDMSVAVGEVGEFGPGDPDHRGIDVVEAPDVASCAIDGERSGPQPDDADLEGLQARIERFQRPPDARGLGVVRRRPPFGLRGQVLGSVQDRAVDQRAMPARAAAELLHAQHPVEIACRDDRPVAERDDAPDRAADGHDGGDDRDRAEHPSI